MDGYLLCPRFWLIVCCIKLGKYQGVKNRFDAGLHKRKQWVMVPLSVSHHCEYLPIAHLRNPISATEWRRSDGSHRQGI